MLSTVTEFQKHRDVSVFSPSPFSSSLPPSSHKPLPCIFFFLLYPAALTWALRCTCCLSLDPFCASFFQNCFIFPRASFLPFLAPGWEYFHPFPEQCHWPALWCKAAGGFTVGVVVKEGRRRTCKYEFLQMLQKRG